MFTSILVEAVDNKGGCILMLLGNVVKYLTSQCFQWDEYFSQNGNLRPAYELNYITVSLWFYVEIFANS